MRTDVEKGGFDVGRRAEPNGRFPPSGFRVMAGVAAIVSALGVGFWWTSGDEPPLLATLGVPGQAVWPLAFSPDGKTLAASGVTNTVTLWDVASRKIRHTLRVPGTSQIHHAHFSPDGRWVVVRRTDVPSNTLTLAVFDVASGQERHRVQEPIPSGFGMVVRFSRDGSRLQEILWDLSGVPGASSTERSWDTATWVEQPPRPFADNMRKTRAFWDVSPDDAITAVGDAQTPLVTLIDRAKGTPLATLSSPGPTPSGSLDIQFSPDGSTLAVGKTDRTIDLWDVATHRLRGTLRGHSRECPPFAVHFSNDPNTMATLGLGRSKRVGKLARSVWSWLDSWGPWFGSRPGAEDSTEALVWDVARGRPRASIKNVAPLIALSDDGATLATSNGDGTIWLWSVSATPATGDAP